MVHCGTLVSAGLVWFALGCAYPHGVVAEMQGGASAAARPTPLTPEQYQALKALERQPQHQRIVDVPATFVSEQARLEADLTHYGFLTALPTVLIVVLIAAAPL